MPSETIVLQSCKRSVTDNWIDSCLQSVHHWASINGFNYLLIGDELFDSMPEPLLLKTKQQIVVATDLARLLKLQELLKQGYQPVIWCDADFLIFNPLNFQVPVTSYSLGREVWVQKDNKNQLRVYIKVHNAFLMFRQGNTFLDFYSETAGKLLTRSLSDLGDRSEGKPFLVRFFDHLRRIVSLFNKNDR